MSQPQKTLQNIMDQLVANGNERGLQLTVYHKGKLVIDACAGVTDASGKTPVTPDTLFPVFSTTKGVAATLAHLLVERKKITYDTPIADVWPEFAAHGKGNILFRHALSHTAGLQFMPAGLTPQDMMDWPKVCAAMAEATPVSPPGAEFVYHPVTFGWIVGEVLRRVDGRPFAQMMNEEICDPLNLTGMFVGLPESEDHRVAVLDEIFPPDYKAPSPDDRTPAGVTPLMRPLHAWMNTIMGRRACVPASNGIMNTRSIARHYAALLPGGVDGVQLLPAERIRLATQPTIVTKPPAPENGKGMGLGYFLGGDANGMGSRKTAFGHAGYGGSLGYADPEQQLAVGLAKNLFGPQGGNTQILRGVRDAFGLSQ